MPDPYEVVFTRSARRALWRDLPEKVATVAFEFVMGPLRQHPRRVGKPLREAFAPLFAARRGDRVVCRIIASYWSPKSSRSFTAATVSV